MGECVDKLDKDAFRLFDITNYALSPKHHKNVKLFGTALLYIGADKTGSTSIQIACESARE